MLCCLKILSLRCSAAPVLRCPRVDAPDLETNTADVGVALVSPHRAALVPERPTDHPSTSDALFFATMPGGIEMTTAPMLQNQVRSRRLFWTQLAAAAVIIIIVIPVVMLFEIWVGHEDRATKSSSSSPCSSVLISADGNTVFVRMRAVSVRAASLRGWRSTANMRCSAMAAV